MSVSGWGSCIDTIYTWPLLQGYNLQFLIQFTLGLLHQYASPPCKFNWNSVVMALFGVDSKFQLSREEIWPKRKMLRMLKNRFWYQLNFSDNKCVLSIRLGGGGNVTLVYLFFLSHRDFPILRWFNQDSNISVENDTYLLRWSNCFTLRPNSAEPVWWLREYLMKGERWALSNSLPPTVKTMTMTVTVTMTLGLTTV